MCSQFLSISDSFGGRPICTEILYTLKQYNIGGNMSIGVNFIKCDQGRTQFYRQQRSCGKVMFLHLSVSHSVHRGVCLRACWDTPPGRYTPREGTPFPGQVHSSPTTVTGADSTHPTGMLSCFMDKLKIQIVGIQIIEKAVVLNGPLLPVTPHMIVISYL